MAKNRKKNRRSFNKKINIFCEGEKNKSENSYLNALICDFNLDTNKINVEVVEIKKNRKRVSKSCKIFSKRRKII